MFVLCPRMGRVQGFSFFDDSLSATTFSHYFYSTEGHSLSIVLNLCHSVFFSVVFSSRSPTPEVKHAKDRANKKAKAAAIGKDHSPTKAARYICVLQLFNGTLDI